MTLQNFPFKKIIKLCTWIIFLMMIFSMPPVLHHISNWMYPGVQSRDSNDLDPQFRKNLEATIHDLEKMGYPVYIGATWRNKERQQFYVSKGYSKIINSQHCGGQDLPHKRKSYAADIYLNLPLIFLPLHAHFYHQLKETAHQHQLHTGASFPKSNPVWAMFNLGWDPGHVEDSQKHFPKCQ